MGELHSLGEPIWSTSACENCPFNHPLNIHMNGQTAVHLCLLTRRETRILPPTPPADCPLRVHGGVWVELDDE